MALRFDAQDWLLARVSPGATEVWVPPRIQRMPGREMSRRPCGHRASKTGHVLWDPAILDSRGRSGRGAGNRPGAGALVW